MIKQVNIPAKAMPLLTPAPYKAMHGGRGGAKSHSIATVLLLLMIESPIRVLCCREVQKSIRDSVKRLIDDKIAEMGLSNMFHSTDREIRCINGGLFSFVGLRNTTADGIKSYEGYKIAWIEEGHTITKKSFELLDATIRSAGAEMWVSWNRNNSNDYVDYVFLGSGSPPEGSIVIQINWRDNPWFPERLKAQMARDKRLDYEYYLHKWEGHLRQRSDAAVFKPPEIEDMDEDIPARLAPRHGADWGMRDPTVLIRCYRWRDADHSPILYIAREVYKIGCEIEEIPSLFAGRCPHSPDLHPERRWYNPLGHKGLLWGNAKVSDILQHRIIGDSASPETIKYLRNRGFDIVPAIKGPGSVEEGVRFIQSHKVVMHPDCEHAREEWDRYSYKIDKMTEEVLPELDDVDNHTVDAVRYAVENDRRRARTNDAALSMPMLITAG